MTALSALLAVPQESPDAGLPSSAVEPTCCPGGPYDRGGRGFPGRAGASAGARPSAVEAWEQGLGYHCLDLLTLSLGSG